jgi:predicted negative regulator of RcsB-dependent stress response
LSEAIAALNATQSYHFLSYLLTLQAQAQMRAGDHAGASQAIEEGIALAATGGERYCGAELHRLRGEVLALSRDQRAAADAFRAAIDIARRQGAVALARKAEASLARHGGSSQNPQC